MTSECEYKRFTPDSNGDLDLWFGAYYDFKYEGIKNNKRSDIDILATDYENYDIGYYCMEMLNAIGLVVKADVVLIYGREQNMSAEKLEEAKQVVREKVP